MKEKEITSEYGPSVLQMRRSAVDPGGAPWVAIGVYWKTIGSRRVRNAVAFPPNPQLLANMPATFRCLILFVAFSIQTLPTFADQWRPLLDQDLSNFEIWMGIPHSTVEGLPEGTFQSEKVTRGTPLGLDADSKNVFSVAAF